jgi:hypothetical protein
VFYVIMFGLYVPVENKDSCFYITLCNTAVPVESNDSCSF